MDDQERVIRITAPAGGLSGQIDLPSSKSISNRALIINALAYSPYAIQNLSDSDDTRVMAAILRSNDAVFDVGHAGTAMRFLTAFLARTAGIWDITGSQRMQQRPIGLLVEALRQLGAQIEYTRKEGFPPLKIYGTHLRGGLLEMDGSISSQYISAMLMVAPTLDGGLTLRLKNRITSRSYITMTLKLLEQAGIRSFMKNNEIRIPEQPFLPCRFMVEADWSAASYWYALLTLAGTGEIRLENLRRSGLQGDEAIARWFEAFGIDTREDGEALVITRHQAISPSRLDLRFHENPDVGQTMAALCVGLGVPFHFSGLETLRIKETDRIAALQHELARFGAMVTEPAPGELLWDGRREPALDQAPPVIQTYDDHRMAMAFAPLALITRELLINNPEVVTKSYPRFWDDLRKVGFLVEEKQPREE